MVVQAERTADCWGRRMLMSLKTVQMTATGWRNRAEIREELAEIEERQIS